MGWMSQGGVSGVFKGGVGGVADLGSRVVTQN